MVFTSLGDEVSTRIFARFEDQECIKRFCEAERGSGVLDGGEWWDEGDGGEELFTEWEGLVISVSLLRLGRGIKLDAAKEHLDILEMFLSQASTINHAFY